MTNLGSSGEAKASPADNDPTIDVPGDTSERRTADPRGRGGSADAAMGAETDPTLDRGDEGGPGAPRVGQGQTAAYGETTANAQTIKGEVENDDTDETSTRTKLGAIPSSYGESGGLRRSAAHEGDDDPGSGI